MTPRLRFGRWDHCVVTAGRLKESRLHCFPVPPGPAEGMDTLQLLLTCCSRPCERNSLGSESAGESGHPVVFCLWTALQTEARASHLNTGSEETRKLSLGTRKALQEGWGQSTAELCPSVGDNIHKAAGTRATVLLPSLRALVG